MAKKMIDDEKPTQIEIVRIKTGSVDVGLLGRTPLILHHGGAESHLLPALKLTQGERATTLKHEPLVEWRERMILAIGDDVPTRLLFPAAAFKGAMMTAALRLPGTVKTEIAQLAWVEGEFVNIYGMPRVRIDTVRNSDMARTPDARSRPCLRNWATRLTVTFVQPMLTAQAVANLLVGGGLFCGVGDWRPEKGKGTFGQFEIVDLNDPRYLAVLKEGREVQDAAIAAAQAYDAETLRLLTWYDEELARRAAAGKAQESRRKKAAPKPNGADGEPTSARSM